MATLGTKLLKYAALGLAVVVVLILLGTGYLFAAFPAVNEAPAWKVDPTPERLARGRYLANHVTGCMDCHSIRDWTRFSGPPKPDTLGAGGERFPEEAGFPGTFYAKNITPANLGEWSDGEIARAITTGITRTGDAMFPLMPYPYYRHLCEDDVKAIVAYLRSLEPIDNEVPETELNFPVNLIVRTIPKHPEPWPCPTPGTAEYGKYLTTVAGCKECHTKQERGKAVGKPYAGGWTFPLPTGGSITSANITPDPETGIGKWTKEQFVAKFRAFSHPGAATRVQKGERNTIMPWMVYGGMTEEDLRAIFDHLRTVEPVRNEVAGFIE